MATFEKLTGSQVKLTIDVTAEQYEEAAAKAYLKTRGKYNVPGFRKGKAPRKMIESMYGTLVFFDDAFDEIYPVVYEAAVKEHSVEPVSRPDISIEDMKEDGAFTFSATVTVKPEVTLGEYKGIEVTVKEYNVTDEMVDAAIEREREKVARMVDVDRAVESGDTVNLDYSGSVDGVKFDGGTAEGQTLVIGSGSFIPGFEEQMVGMAKDEEKDITVTFPTEYHSEELAGKEAVFAVRVNGIQTKELPELDDEFAKDVSEFDTLAELKASKRTELEAAAKKNADSEKENAAIKVAVDNASVEIPEVMVDSQLDYMIRDISYRLSTQGMSFDDYCMFTGTTADEVKKSFRPEAEQRVKSQLVLDAICAAESISASDEEIDAELEKYASQMGADASELKKNFTDDDKAYFAERVTLDKTIAVIVDNASFKTEKPADENKKPAAKKSAAKKKTKTEESAEEPAKESTEE